MKATPKRNVLRVNSSTADDQQNPSIAIDQRGNFVIAWQSESEENDEEVFARSFFPGGTAFAPEFLVNFFREGNQERPAVGIDGVGNTLIAWQGENQGNAGSGIAGQRFQVANDNFLPIGSQFPVNTTTQGRQQNPDVSFNPLRVTPENQEIREARSFVVVWQGEGRTTNNIIGRDDSGFGVFAQRYNSAGTPQGRAFLVNTTIQGDQINPAVGTDANGNIVVVWQSRNRGNFDIFGQKFDSLGNPIGDQFQVNTFVRGDQINPDITVDRNGSFVVVWQDEEQDGSGSGIYARRFSARGNPLGAGNFRVNSVTNGDQVTPSIDSDGKGGFTVVWASDNTGNFEIVGQQFRANGQRIDGQLQVSRTGNRDQTRPQIAVRPNGNFVVAWQADQENNQGTDILARRFTVPQNGSTVVPIRRSLATTRSTFASDSASDLLVGTPDDDLLQGGKDSPTQFSPRSYPLSSARRGDRMLLETGNDAAIVLASEMGGNQLTSKGNLPLDDRAFHSPSRMVLSLPGDSSIAAFQRIHGTASTADI